MNSINPNPSIFINFDNDIQYDNKNDNENIFKKFIQAVIKPKHKQVQKVFPINVENEQIPPKEVFPINVENEQIPPNKIQKEEVFPINDEQNQQSNQNIFPKNIEITKSTKEIEKYQDSPILKRNLDDIIIILSKTKNKNKKMNKNMNKNKICLDTSTLFLLFLVLFFTFISFST